MNWQRWFCWISHSIVPEDSYEYSKENPRIIVKARMRGVCRWCKKVVYDEVFVQGKDF